MYRRNPLQAVMGISKMIERHPADASSFGPLCHTLSRLAASEHRAVVAYAARGIKLLVLDDALRPQATVAGIPSVLAAALREWEDDAPCLREILGWVGGWQTYRRTDTRTGWNTAGGEGGR